MDASLIEASFFDMTKFVNYLSSYLNYNLLLIGLVAVILSPLWQPVVPEILKFDDLLFVIIIASGLNEVKQTERLSRRNYTLSLFVLVYGLINLVFDVGPVLEGIFKFILIYYLYYLTYAMVRFIVKRENADYPTLINAMSGYLLLGLGFAILVAVLDSFLNGGFSVEVNDAFGFGGYVYYSFVTLTTLGYGDIHPVHPSMQALSIVISVCGIFYTTMVVGVIIGKFLSQNQKK